MESFMKLTNVQEEYLKTIYLLQLDEGKSKLTDIAEKLNKSKASVNSAINNLVELGLVDNEKYGPITLTDQGKAEAKKIVAANDIVTLFLVDVLGVEEEKAQEEAQGVKTILSDESLNKLARYTYKELGLTPKECGYNINNEKCFQCGVSIKAKKIMEKKD
jgi:DtxR family Mn-dependent transcriptional regulator